MTAFQVLNTDGVALSSWPSFREAVAEATRLRRDAREGGLNLIYTVVPSVPAKRSVLR